MRFEKVINCFFKYLEKEIVPGMNGLQEIAFFSLREAVDDELENWVATLTKNPFMRAVVAIDKEGNVDVEKLFKRIRAGMEKKGEITIEIPLYGTIKFLPEDIDNIANLMREVDCHENYQDFRGIN